MSPFLERGIEIDQLPAYTSRSLVRPGTAVVGAETKDNAEDIRASHGHLRQIDIGADQLVLAPGSSITKSLVSENDSLAQVKMSLDSGRPLSLFTPRLPFLVRQVLGLRFRDTVAINPWLAEQFDHKLLARHLPGVGQLFSPWQKMRTDPPQFKRLFDLVLEQAAVVLETNSVMLKDPGADGGESNLLVGPETDPAELSTFLAKHGHKTLVLEAAYPARQFKMTEISAQVAVGANSWSLEALTEQITENNAHRGNIGMLGHRLVDKQTYQAILRVITPICQLAVARGLGKGLTRTIGIDMLVIRQAGQIYVFVIEINARSTAAVYLCAVAQQMAPRFGGQICVIMEIDKIPEGMRRQDLLEHRIDGMLCDGTDKPSIIPGMPGCSGKALLFFLGKDRDQAEGIRYRYHDRLRLIGARRGRISFSG
ncbi:MAG: hypothetical protein V1695_02595 [Candidatus Uhrbacteria bacterium]